MSQSNFYQNFNNLKLTQELVYGLETLTTAAPAASLTVPITILNADNNAVAATLAAGKTGQVKIFIASNVDNAVTLVPVSLLGASTTITFDQVGGGCTLIYTGSAWTLIGTSTSQNATSITNELLAITLS